MTKLIKILLVSLILIAVGFSVTAQEIPEVELDEEISPEDLEIKKPRILPDHPFYLFKDGWRKIQEFFTFNPIAKMSLKQRFTSERVIELDELVKKEAPAEIIKRAVENYRRESEEMKERVMKLEIKAKENPALNSFFDKFLHQQTLHRTILQRLENQVPPEVFEKIKEEREKHLERFKDVMLKLEEKEKILERLEKTFEKIKGSEFKEFKNLEILKELEEKVPEEIKEKIKELQERGLKRFQEKLEEMPLEKQERFGDYIEKISGERERHLEILENLKSKLEEKPVLRERFQGYIEKISE